MSDVLILSTAAEEFANEISRSTNGSISVTQCRTLNEALNAYEGEHVVFGNPDLVAEVLPNLPEVRWVQSTWAGVLPLLNIERRDYVLTGIKDVFGPQMSEYVLGHILAHELKILERSEHQRQRHWDNRPSGNLHGKKLLMLGTGSISRHVAKSAASFGIRVIGLNRSGVPADEFEEVGRIEELQRYAKDCDYVVACLPQTHGTDNLLDEETLAVLPSHAYFVNIGRSNVVDDDALIDALRNERLAGVSLDVFDQEPVPTNSPLWTTPNLLMSAHIAARSHPSLIAPIFVENFRRYSNNEPLNYVIDFEQGY